MRRWISVVFAMVLTASMGALPAHADEGEWAGFTCGFSSTNDPTGAVQQNPDVQMGEANGGPVFSADLIADDGSGASSHAALDHITIVCSIQVNDPLAGGTSAASVSGSGTGVAVAAGQITYTASSTDNIYLCSYWWLVHNGISYHYYFDDDDDPSNGIQCSLAISTGG